jgi:TRAP-type mannitol/chloroaromatic compound transport system substrate-binding protein
MVQKSSKAKRPLPARAARRSLLKSAGVAGIAAATIGFPHVSRAQTTTWRFQSTWPQKDIFHEFAQDYARRVNEMSGARFKLEVLSAGTVVGAFQMLDAVHAGALDGGHGVAVYWYGKHKGFSLFGTGPAFGWDANQFLSWVYYGGGSEYYRELLQDVLKLNVVGFLTGPMPTQPLGWFKKEITGPQDLANMKYRTVGLSADLFKEMGVAVTILPGGEIVPAIDRGLIDGAEFNNPSSDRVLGFPDVAKIYMLRSYHQRSECFEIVFNKTKFDPLPAEQKAILKYGAEAASADMSWKAQDRYSRDLEEMQAKQGVKAIPTPETVLDAQLKVWDKLIAELSKDPFNKKVIDSQMAFVKRVGAFEQLYEADSVRAYKHFFTS